MERGLGVLLGLELFFLPTFSVFQAPQILAQSITANSVEHNIYLNSSGVGASIVVFQLKT